MRPLQCTQRPSRRVPAARLSPLLLPPCPLPPAQVTADLRCIRSSVFATGYSLRFPRIDVIRCGGCPGRLPAPACPRLPAC